MIFRTRSVLGALTLVSAVAVSGCARGCTSSRPPIHPNPSMDDQPKVLTQTSSEFFFNGASMRDPVPGTIAIDGLKEDIGFFTGKAADGKFVATIPRPVDDAVLERGRQRYTIYCQPCHDARGDGRGILFQRGNVPTATYHQDKILNYPDGQIFDVITNGVGLMQGYRWPIPPSDRWAIVAYVRRLEKDRLARMGASSYGDTPVPAAQPGAAPGGATPAGAPPAGAAPPAGQPATAPAVAQPGTAPVSTTPAVVR
jgi:mono/diheme cytochrome c family protein